MPTLPFRLLDVFALQGTPFSGNPLAVVLDAGALDPTSMQAIARQFNLSETTFLSRARRDGADARADVRIFTPTIEMPFAGHPTLGTAAVVRSLFPEARRLILTMPVGDVEVGHEGDRFSLRAKKAPTSRKFAHEVSAVAAMLGLAAQSIRGAPRWIDTGTEQLVIELEDDAALDRLSVDAVRFRELAFLPARGEAMAYLVAPTRPDGTTRVRFLFSAGSAILEDPATGSACANLGGYLLTGGSALPASRRISQGVHVARPSQLFLDVAEDGAIHVAGLVAQTGRGTLEVP